MGKLTQSGIGKVTKPGRYGDGAGLYLNIAKGGSKSWILRMVVDGRRRDIGLGGWPSVSVRDARLKANQTRDQVKKGIHRTNEIQDHAPMSTAPTFRDEFEDYYRRNHRAWKNEGSRKQYLYIGKKHLLPYLGDMQITEIRKLDVVECLIRLKDMPPTQKYTRIVAKKAFERAVTLEILPSNPAEDLYGAMPKTRYRSTPHRSLPPADIPAAYQRLDEFKSKTMTMMTRFLILTAARSIEAREARWDEIDSNLKAWVIQPERMKQGQLHRVPLSEQAWDIIIWAQSRGIESEYIFARRETRQPYNRNKIYMEFLPLGLDTTVHGFRASFRTWAEETREYQYDEMEYAMSHAIGDAGSRPYIRTDLLEERRLMMQAWADYVTVGHRQFKLEI